MCFCFSVCLVLLWQHAWAASSGYAAEACSWVCTVCLTCRLTRKRDYLWWVLDNIVGLACIGCWGASSTGSWHFKADSSVQIKTTLQIQKLQPRRIQQALGKLATAQHVCSNELTARCHTVQRNYWGRSTGAVQRVIYSPLNQSLLDRGLRCSDISHTGSYKLRPAWSNAMHWQFE